MNLDTTSPEKNAPARPASTAGTPTQPGWTEGPAGVRMAPDSSQRPLHLGVGHIPMSQRVWHNALMTMDHLLTRKLADKWIGPMRKKHLARVMAHLEKRGPGTLYPIDRRRDLTPEQFHREYLLRGIPVVLEGAAKEWGCCKKWSLKYFAEHYGEDKVTVAQGYPQHQAGGPKNYILMKDVLDNKNSDNMKYLRFHPMLALHPELTADFPYEWFKRHKKRWHLYTHMQFFIGTKGTTTGTHDSQMANLFVMVHGEKTWYLHPTNYTAFMDPPTTRSVFRLGRHNTGKVFEDPYRVLDGYKVHLKQGDILWNPPFYWHSVENLTDTIGVGFRWNDKRLAMQQHFTMFMLDWLAIDPSWFYMCKVGRDETRRMLGKGGSGKNLSTPST